MRRRTMKIRSPEIRVVPMECELVYYEVTEDELLEMTRSKGMFGVHLWLWILFCGTVGIGLSRLFVVLTRLS